ncbi:MAG: TnpV protein [Clostridiales bacterium]|nr:TnpV protein [Clostridiales bacterium]
MDKIREKITYRKEGDYLIPDLAVDEDVSNNYKIGKYGYLKLDWLKNNKRGLYTELMLDGKLTEHLVEVDKQANARVKEIVEKLAEVENVNENLKQNNQIEWVGLMNNFKNQAEEIVFNELIYN